MCKRFELFVQLGDELLFRKRQYVTKIRKKSTYSKCYNTEKKDRKEKKNVGDSRSRYVPNVIY